jgi:hypothetical protein
MLTKYDWIKSSQATNSNISLAKDHHTVKIKASYTEASSGP